MFIEVAEYPGDGPEALVVRVDSDRVSLALFRLDSDHKIMPDPSIAVFDRSTAMTVFEAERVDGLLLNGELYGFVGKSAFSFSDIMGDDEVVDFSIIDFYLDRDGPLPWVSRLASTRPEKILYSARYRDIERYSLMASIYVPFATGTLADCVLHLVGRGAVICNQPIGNAFDGSALPIGPNGGARWREHFYSAELAIISQDADSTLIEAHLKWNSDGSPCSKSPLFYLEESAGYLPKRRVKFENGSARFTVSHLGLQSGDQIKVKVNAKHFTSLGQLEFLVP